MDEVEAYEYDEEPEYQSEPVGSAVEKPSKSCPSPPELSSRGAWECSDNTHKHQSICILKCNEGYDYLNVGLSKVSKFFKLSI